MKKLSAVFFILFACFQASAQNFSITGRIMEEGTENGVPSATVLLQSLPDSTQVDGVISDFDGNFNIPGIPKGNYLIKIQYLGFKTLYKSIQLNQNLQLGVLELSEEATALDEVTINARRATGEQKGDTTLYNAAAFKTMRDASAQTLVQKLPGVVMMDGALQAQGENIAQILVDGKPFFGGDITTALQNLPAEVIQGIEIYDQKSEKAQLSGFDDGERLKTINIVTKPNRRKGQFGKTTAGYGTDDRYLLGASINSFNEDQRITFTGLSNDINLQDYSSDANSQNGGGGRPQNGIITTNILGLNYTDNWGEKIKVSASYLYRKRKNEGISSLFREYVTSSDSDQTYAEDSRNTRTNQDHRFDMRFEYQINENNRLVYRPRLSAAFDKENSGFLGQSMNADGPLNQTENVRTADNQDYDLYNRLYFSHKFAKKGRSFTISANQGSHANKDDALRRAENQYYQPEERTEIINQNITRDRTGFNWDVGVSYTEPIGEKGQMEFEYEIGNRGDDSDQLTYDILNEGELDYDLALDTALSNTFESKYLNQEVELGYQYKMEKVRFQVEMEYQMGKLQNDQTFPQPFDLTRTFDAFLPTIRFDYEINDNTNFELDYDTDTDAPRIDQLQSVIDNSNPLQLRTGNPDLDQSYSNRIRGRFRTNNPDTDHSFFLFAQAQIVKNTISNSSFIADETTELANGIILEKGSQLFLPVNLDGARNFRSWMSYGMPLGFVKSNFNINGGLSFDRRPGQVNGELSFNNSQRFSTGISLTSNISDQVDFNISTRGSFNKVENTLNPALNNKYYNQYSRLNFSWIIWQGIVYRLDVNHQLNTGLSEGFDINFVLMNMSLGKKIFNNQRGEISLNVYDLLGQNNSVRRNVTDIYIEDVQNNVLQRYFMLSFSYNLRRFSKGTDMDDYNEIYN
ncbi:outer membrane beta-barrel protein [Algoriphagus halophytocola]|uniref:Outer membrane beta-barrel protein n=1 Tax=Algoriphagus halophytocola TaxID=2991499 RepID=A0ABY6MKS9_9BACT|nr:MULTISPECIES: outer membrane beta-barrel protein [unclassified Algoriphagus]UZD24124.1 outer membrane beta-barrel protein [Algoriphagus sp. TR-M5]WBL41495.1 outer membrane beta-barrel protein [Algoriphagus sp. TR-M9]